MNLLGQVLWLMMRSDPHKPCPVGDLEWRIRVPLLLQQCRLFMRQARPFAFVTWAFATEDVARRLAAGPVAPLRVGDWRGGPQPVIVDVIAPFGRGEDCRREVMRSVFRQRVDTTPRHVSAPQPAAAMIAAQPAAGRA